MLRLWNFAFLTLILRSQPENDESSTNKSIKRCNKKQPQGRIVDLLKKQAQQLPSNTGSGLKPTGVSPMSRDAKNFNNQYKRPAPSCSGATTSLKGRPLGTISAVPSGAGADLQRKSVAKCSATSCSGPLSRSERAQTLSKRTSVSRSSRDYGLSSAVHHKEGGSSRRRASPAPASTHKQHLLNSMDRPADLLSTQLCHEIPDQAPITHPSPPDHMSMHACKRTPIEATRTHRIVEKPSLSPKENSRGAHMYSTLIFGVRLTF